MNFIKKIWDNEIDSFVKRQFTKLGMGEYENRGLMSIKNRKSLLIKTSYEFCNDLFQAAIKYVEEPVQVTGSIISNEDISNDFEEVKKKQKLLIVI